jgi:DNA-binding LacI/PurR family transcriptional regulator
MIMSESTKSVVNQRNQTGQGLLVASTPFGQQFTDGLYPGFRHSGTQLMLAESNPIPGPSQLIEKTLIEKTEDGAIRAGGRDFHVIGRVFFPSLEPILL